MPISIIGGIADALGKIAGSVVKPILDKFVGDKMSDSEKALVAFEVERQAVEAVQKEKETFLNFVLDHTGAAKDMPRLIQILRGSVRPIITYASFGAFIWVSWWSFNNISAVSDVNQLTIVREVHLTIKALLLIVAGFWFGERLLTRTGITHILMNRKNGGSQ
jgi:hypothetical protein